MSFHYSEALLPNGAKEENLYLAWWDIASKTWIPLKDLTVDTNTNTVSGSVEHFTMFALIGKTVAPKLSVTQVSVTPSSVKPGEVVTVTADVVNRGSSTGIFLAVLKIDGTEVETQSFELDAGGAKSLTFLVSRSTPKQYYTADVNGVAGYFTVLGTTATTTTTATSPTSVAPALSPETVTPTQSPEKSLASFSLSGLTVVPSDKIAVGQEVLIDTVVSNSGDAGGTYDVVLKLNNTVRETRTIDLDGKTSAVLEFKVIPENGGVFSIDINGRTAYFEVQGGPLGAVSVNWFAAIGLMVLGIGLGISAVYLMKHLKSGAVR